MTPRQGLALIFISGGGGVPTWNPPPPSPLAPSFWLIVGGWVRVEPFRKGSLEQILHGHRSAETHTGGGKIWQVRNSVRRMWHSKLVPHFAVVFKDWSHVLAFTKSMRIFSPLQGSEGLHCWTSCSVGDHDHGQVMGGPGNNSNHPRK